MPPTQPAHPGLPDSLIIPGLAMPLSLRLPVELAALREAALDFHQRNGTAMPPIPELTLSDAAAWAARPAGEDWLIWRARLVAARLRAMPVELAAGERIAGRPRFRDPSDAERPALDAARQTLTAVPPFPGGDAGHFHPDYEKLFRLGVRGMLDEIAQRRRTVADWPSGRVEASVADPSTSSGREDAPAVGPSTSSGRVGAGNAVADWPSGRVEASVAGPSTGSGREDAPVEGPSTGAGGGAAERVAFYDACRIALEGMSAYIGHVADACAAMAGESAGSGRSLTVPVVARSETGHSIGGFSGPDEASRSHWLELAAICRHVATEPPRTFHEAIQLLFLTLVALWQGEGHGLTSPGRLDRTLRPFYEADLAAGRITPQVAFELIVNLYIQVNRVMPTGLALAVMVGGRDAAGDDVTNDLTYLCIAARIVTGLGYPTVGFCWHRAAPPELTDFAVQMLAYGRGDPAFFNDELIIAGLGDHGVRPEDAPDYMNSTCVEIKPVGASNIWVTAPYFNVPQGLLDEMDAVATGAQPAPATFEELEARVRANLTAKVAAAAAQLDRVWRDRATRGCFPLASCFTDDCLARGLDFDRGGARYNWVENSFVGLANLADSLVAVCRLVYEERSLTLAGFAAILRDDYQGHEMLRQRIANKLPKYGNDNDEADEVARRWAGALIEMTEAQTIGPHRYVPGFFCWIMHERLGGQTGATPDGRRACWPLADGAGAAQGRERHGPTASALSTTKWSHREALGGLVHNAKFSQNLFKTEDDRAALRRLIETYLLRGGFEMQVNVVSRDTLLAAREHPEQYRDLLVRVAGYSDYFTKLSPKMQEEVVARTEHEM